MKEGTGYIRDIFWMEEFTEFYKGLPDKIKTKFDYVISEVITRNKQR